VPLALRKAARTRFKKVVGAKPGEGEKLGHSAPVRSFSIIAV
jgi:hypothetical protein